MLNASLVAYRKLIADGPMAGLQKSLKIMYNGKTERAAGVKYPGQEVINMTITKSNDKTEVMPIINKFVESIPPKGKGWFLVISTPNELIIRKTGKQNIMDAQGLGKEIWEGVDVEKYIAEERASWG